MIIAVPVSDGCVSQHFGHADTFLFFSCNPETKEILKQDAVTPPEHAPGILPPWLAEQGATVIIASGIGGRAVDLLRSQNIQVASGAVGENPEEMVRQFLAGSLECTEAVCNH